MKRVTAGGFYRFFNALSTSTKLPENAGDFRLIDRKVVEALKQLPERNRFMKGLFAWAGFRAVGVPYERPARHVAGDADSNRRDPPATPARPSSTTGSCGTSPSTA